MKYRVYIDKVYHTSIEVEADNENEAGDLAIDIAESDLAAFEFSHYEVETEKLE